MSEELEVLKEVAQKLNKSLIPYMISGSVAMSFYACPRMTRDIDIVVALYGAQVRLFSDLFRDEYYIDEDMVKTEVARKGMFNLIHNRFIIKIDFILQKKNEFSESEFSRRRMVDLDGVKVWIVSPEDLVLSKLNWAKESISEMQLQDIRNIIKMSENLELEYINKWINQLNLQEIYARVV